MRIVIDIAHPGHVHFFKNFIWEMKKRNHEILITAGDKDVTINLLENLGFDYTFTCKRTTGYKLIIEIIKRDIQMWSVVKKYDPDIVMGIASTIAAHISKVTSVKSVVFTDTEHTKLADMITYPFSDVIVTPSCYKKNLGGKHVKYNGYHELAYLHPNYFTPDPTVLTELGLTEAAPFTILRFVSWGASHDVGHSGLTLDTKRRAIQEFEKYGRVFITSEKSLPQKFEKYRIAVAPEKMHDLLYYATLLYGESATMASECAVLGTHAIFCDFAGRGYTDEEEIKYDLVYNYNLDNESQIESVNKGVQLLQEQDLKVKGRKKRERLLADNIDVTSYMIWFVENYPDSVSTAKENPEILKRFK